MWNLKRGVLLLTVICVVTTALAAYVFGGIDPVRLQGFLRQAGIWAPLVYILVYAVATLVVVPTTPLNLAAGAIFGPWLGTLYTSIAATLGAVIGFLLSRTIGRQLIAARLNRRWPEMDAEIRRGGFFYIFAMRVLPIIPYGLISYAAGLTSVRFRHYLLATVPGTIVGILPFVLIGSSGLKAVRTGDVLPLMAAFALTGMLIAGANWYRNTRQGRGNLALESETGEG